MNRTVLLLMVLLMPLPAAASHTWANIDLCETYKDKLPPGLTAASLPETHSPGAVLLDQYCTQCHNLPGPDRHTVAEWRDVAPRMFVLMDVSNRFGGLMGKVKTMRPQDQEILLVYLERHATNSMMDKTPDDNGVIGRSSMTGVLALLPFLLLTGLGLLRWWRHVRIVRKPCVID